MEIRKHVNKSVLILNFIYILSIPCYSQKDSSYIKSYNEKYTIQTFTEKKFIFLKTKDTNGKNRTFNPNNPQNIGLGLSVRNTFVSFGYGYGFDFMRDKDRGKTKSFDFQYHYYGDKITIDAYSQNYKGFYIEENEDNKRFKLAPDLHIKYYSLLSHYVFNGNKFSYKAAVNQSEKQIKSVGSFLLGGGIFYTKILADSSFVYEEKHKISSLQIGTSLGYAYTYVINPRIYVSASTTVGISFGNKYGSSSVVAFGNVQPRFFAGYIQDKWSLVFAMQTSINLPSDSGDNEITTISGIAQIKYIRRLNYIPILSKIFK